MATARSAVAALLPLLLCSDQGQAELESPEKDPQAWPRNPATSPHPPNRANHSPVLSEHLLCVEQVPAVREFMGVQGVGQGAGGETRSKALGAHTGSISTRRGLRIYLFPQFQVGTLRPREKE